MIKSKHTIYGDIFVLIHFCKSFLKHPVEKIKNVPTVSWESTVVGVFAINIVCGILRAFYQFSLLDLLISLLITPLIAPITLLLIALFIYYFFQLVFKETYNFETICSILFLSYVPGALFFLGSVLYPPLFVPGLVIVSVLLVMGLEENFKVAKKTLIKMVSAGAAFTFIFWMAHQYYSMKTSVHPKTMDQLEQEMKDME